jgi:hypothetical protein
VSDAETSKLRDASQFTDDPAGWSKRWGVEIDAAQKSLEKWHKDGETIVDRFLDRRNTAQTTTPGGSGDTHVNLFPANIQTMRSYLYGKTPQVDVKRRWGDPNDPVARAAGEAYQRLLNTDIERDSDSYVRALKYALSDRLLPGFGLCKLRYVADFKDEQVAPKYKTDDEGPEDGPEAHEDEEPGSPEDAAEEQTEPDEAQMLAPGYTKTVKTREDVEIDYKNWKDVLWSAGARTFEEVRWFGFKEPLTRAGLKARFGPMFKKAYGKDWEKKIEDIPLDSASNKNSDDNHVMAKPDPWARADVWEIWDKEHRKVWWWVKGFSEILDDKEDPLGLDGFWPFPMPMVANLTTDAFIPRPDYILAQDLYEELNVVSSRITLLERALVVRGVYNGAMPAIGRLLEEAGENQLIPIPEWPQFKESGGIQQNVEWMPLEAVSGALEVLRDYRKELIALLQQVTGMSDILRGEASQGSTATEQAIKAKFASVRLQDFQDEFARFASDIQRLKAEIISKHFDDQTIIERANVVYTADAQYFMPPQPQPGMPPPPPDAPPEQPPALKLMRDQFMWYRIQVKAESVSATDYAAMQQERTVAVQTLTQFLTQVFPIGQAAPAMLPFLLEMGKWLFTGMRGAQTIEGTFDQAVQKANEMAQAAQNAPPKPDPKLEAEQMRAQSEKHKADAEIVKTGLQLNVDKAKIGMEMHSAQQDHEHKQVEHQMSMQRTEAEIRKDAMKSVTGVVPHNSGK